MTQTPNRRVTVGMPIRNGAATLPAALDAVLAQTHVDLQVVISDNYSTDATAEICQDYAAQDPRIRYVRQPQLLTVIANFAYVYRQADTPYFMWAAHDDDRDVDFVAKLLGALEANPHASLAMSRIALFTDAAHPELATPLDYTCATAGLSLPALVRRRRRCMCYEIYGLFRTSALGSCRFRDYPFAPDFPIVVHALVAGELVSVPDTEFRYFVADKTAEYRAAENAYDGVPKAPSSRLAGLCALAAWESYRTSTHPQRAKQAVGVTVGTAMGLAKGGSFEMAPDWAKRLWWSTEPQRAARRGVSVDAPSRAGAGG